MFAGDDIYVLGFPMGLAGTSKKYAVVRAGVIARLDEEVLEEEKAFWIDAAVYPGNSGGPVVLRPVFGGIEGTKTIGAAYVMGIVSSYIPYRDVAVSVQSQRPRVIFEENSGLARVVPMNAVFGACADFRPPPPEASERQQDAIAASDLGERKDEAGSDSASESASPKLS